MKYYRTERIYMAIGYPQWLQGRVASRAAWIAMATQLAGGRRLQTTYRPDQAGLGMNNRHDINLDFLAATPELIQYVQQYLPTLRPQYLTATQKDELWQQLNAIDK